MARSVETEDRAGRGGGRWRLMAFRVAAALLAAVFLVGLFPALEGIVVNWLPEEMFLRARPDLGPTDVVHRLHSTALAVLSWGMVIGVGVQPHAPERKVGAMLMALAVPPVLAVGELLTGTFTALGTGVPFALLLVLALLHPRSGDLLRMWRPDPAMAGLALIGAVPWIAYAVEQGGRGLLAPEWDVAHHGFVASLGSAVVLWSLLGALDQRGWLWPASGAGIAAGIVALQSLIFPEVLSGLSRGWAMAALAWAASYLVAAGARRRRGRSRSAAPAASPLPDPPPSNGER